MIHTKKIGLKIKSNIKSNHICKQNKEDTFFHDNLKCLSQSEIIQELYDFCDVNENEVSKIQIENDEI